MSSIVALVICAQCSINAPKERVWEVLVDFAGYSDWNPLIRSVRSELKVGAPVDMQIDLGRGLFHQREFVKNVVPGQSLDWGMNWKLSFLCGALRTQEICDGPSGGTVYRTRDDIWGLLSPLVSFVHGPMLRERFEQMAQALKHECERREGSGSENGGIAA